MVYENLIINNPSSSSEYKEGLVTDYELESENIAEGGSSFQ